jgi:tetratricopeptide (TPR) repeat protein
MVGVAKNIPSTPNLEQISALRPQIPHLAFVATDLTECLQPDDLIWPFTSLGRFYLGQGLYQQAQPWLQQSLEITKQQLGAEHPNTAITLNNLALLYRVMGRYTEAEPLYLEALRILLTALGQDHPNAESVTRNFALFLRQVMAENRTAELSDHPETQQRLADLLDQTTTP